MPRLIPFSNNFSTTSGTTGTKKYILSGRFLRSFTAYIETDLAGPVLISVYVEALGFKHQLGEPKSIIDGEGYTAKRFNWTGELPLSRVMPNYLYIEYSNYCGLSASIRFTGVVQK